MLCILFINIHGDLSRRLQLFYNYVGQTNDWQPLLISAVGRLRDFYQQLPAGSARSGTAAERYGVEHCGGR
jgi:hypothetical protein